MIEMKPAPFGAALERLRKFAVEWKIAQRHGTYTTTVYELHPGDPRHAICDIDDIVAILNFAEAQYAAAPNASRQDISDVLIEALEDFCRAAEYWAGCDEDCDPDTASSEIMRSGGSWPACAYDKARDALRQAKAGGA